jgi:hypothetical protein
MRSNGVGESGASQDGGGELHGVDLVVYCCERG